MVWDIPPFCHHARKARAVWVCWRRQTELFERSRRIRSRSLSWIHSSLFLDANTPPRSGLPWRISWCERKTSLEWRRGEVGGKVLQVPSQTNGLLRSCHSAEATLILVRQTVPPLFINFPPTPLFHPPSRRATTHRSCRDRDLLSAHTIVSSLLPASSPHKHN